MIVGLTYLDLFPRKNLALVVLGALLVQRNLEVIFLLSSLKFTKIKPLH